MARTQVIIIFLFCTLHSLHCSFYCPYQHRHLGRNILRLQGFTGDVSGADHDQHHHDNNGTNEMPRPEFWTSQKNQTEPRLICPSGCLCKASDDDIKVVCGGHYEDHFPLDGVPANTSELLIRPSSGDQNRLTLSPTLRMLRNLRILDITHSSIPNIGKRTLYGLSKLKSLNLSHNSISHLVDANFDGLGSLTSLSLHHNSIKSITSAAFHHLKSLEYLSLDYNNIRELAPRIFYKLDKLKHLDLSHNKLLLVDEEVLKDIRNIQHISCSSCGLTNFRVGFGLRFLRVLELSENNIESLNDLEPHLLRGLATLDISGNRISKVDKLDMMQIEVLNLSRNKIQDITDCAFCLSTKLTHIDISQNGLLEIGNIFGSQIYENLKYFSLSHNMIQVPDISKTIKKFPGLEAVHLSKMNIISIPSDMFTDNIFLKTINLSSNYLVTIDNGIIDSLRHLQVLDLSSNLIMGLEENFFKSVDSLSSLAMVHLVGNPWVCDKCNIGALRSWLQTSLMYWGACFPHPGQAPAPACLRCSYPTFLNNTPVKDVILVPDCSHMNPSFSSVKVALNQIGTYIAIGIGVIVLCFFTLFIISKYRHYGVYNTGEKDDKESNILIDPIHILDRESDSYVNLRYPTLAKD